MWGRSYTPGKSASPGTAPAGKLSFRTKFFFKRTIIYKLLYAIGCFNPFCGESFFSSKLLSFLAYYLYSLRVADTPFA
ncbi:MAG: hypothetical protein C5B47_02935 [Verrucomicrobia bacterium]|nr:MAG: hypothetical protein C5B47_02935 [Verrucomicrobiota bacterium]